MVAESNFYREIRQFALTAPTWEQARRYFTLPDERWDLTLVSERVYGTRDEYLTILAAAGLDRVNQELTPRELVLPTPERLALIKARTGYSTDQVARAR